MSRKKNLETIDVKEQKNSSTLLTVVLILLIIILVAVLIMGKAFTNSKEELSETPNNGENTNNTVDENAIYNTNEDVIGDKILGDITFTNIECSFDGNRSLLEYTIINNGNKAVKLGNYELVVKDEEKNIIAILVPSANYELKPGEEYNTGNAIDINLSKVHSIELRQNS